MELVKVILLAAGVFGIGMLGMAINILLKKGGKFPNTHVSGNKYLKRNGIYCAQTQDKIEQKKAWSKVNFKKVRFTQNMEVGK